MSEKSWIIFIALTWRERTFTVDGAHINLNAIKSENRLALIFSSGCHEPTHAMGRETHYTHWRSSVFFWFRLSCGVSECVWDVEVQHQEALIYSASVCSKNRAIVCRQHENRYTPTVQPSLLVHAFIFILLYGFYFLCPKHRRPSARTSGRNEKSNKQLIT